MRASVSDILLFRKCPKLWWLSQRWQPRQIAKALSDGIEIHAEVESYLKSGIIGPRLAAVRNLEYLSAIKANYTILGVEKAFAVEFDGHTLLGRPDAILQRTTTGNIFSFQLKSAARNMPHHNDIVRVSPHEACYAYAMSKIMNKPISGIIVCRYIKTKEPIVISDIQIPSAGTRSAILMGMLATLDDMEKYAQKEEKEIPLYTNACYDWITGSPCSFVDVCHHRMAPADGYAQAVDRYPEFPLGGGGGSNPVQSVHSEPDKLDTVDDIPQS